MGQELAAQSLERQLWSNGVSPSAAHVFAALGDKTRLKLIERLCDSGPSTVSCLTDSFEVTRQAISKHQRVLELAGWGRNRRSGRESVWQVERARLEDAQKHFDAISRQWDGALERLRGLVAD